jgi:hypothetical protein
VPIALLLLLFAVIATSRSSSIFHIAISSHQAVGYCCYRYGCAAVAAATAPLATLRRQLLPPLPPLPPVKPMRHTA